MNAPKVKNIFPLWLHSKENEENVLELGGESQISIGLAALLKKGQVDVWYIKFDDAPSVRQMENYRDAVTAEELMYANNCAFKRREEFLIARAALRMLLTKYFPQWQPLEWSFKQNEYGKPEVDFPKVDAGIRFNVSHSDRMVIIAFGKTEMLGVDVEQPTRSGDLREIAESHFAPSEIAELKLNQGENFLARFFHYWTLKEAFIKAVGMGLSLPLDQFAFDLSSTDISITIADQIKWIAGNWHFKLISINDGYQVALAVKSADAEEIQIREKGFFREWKPAFVRAA